ncbi:diaminopimelate decarboxylase family protein [Streptomyces katsurahamanus]|uniref:Diaminopimelate decarboxylase n=1 Tax=Streptomyces katsurahamanus TaxID=2577098 RepID=A0ABW9NS75_9ACTN|nr:diaminopimelate decarboxylase [Streptomyces katsurahamanus]MQS36014.1 diaminopimelate decarboxylase [Streptomyces katsurahamanus]
MTAVSVTTVPDPGFAAPSAWPASAVPAPGGDVAVGGVPLAGLAERYGTPLYVLDEDEVRSRARAWRRALPDAEVVYAARAFLCRAVVDWMEQEGLGLAVGSAGERELAATCGFPADRIVLHGHARSPHDLRTALRLGVGRIVIGSGGEIASLAARVPGPEPQQVMVRVRPDAGGPGRIRAVAGAQRSGLSVADGDAEEAVARILGQPCLELIGLHSHPGSQITSPEPYARSVRRMIAFMARIRDRYGITLPEIDLGGGFAVACPPGHPAPAPAAYGRRIHDELIRCCAEFDYPLPRLTVEPGRSVLAGAGVVLHRVLAVRRMDGRVFASVDGGTGDAPGADRCGARRVVRLVGRSPEGPTRATTVVAGDSEAGEVLAGPVELPADLRPGDVLAAPVSGAYRMSPVSGRALTGGPAVAAVRGGRSRLLVRRETFDDHRARDVGL